MRLIIIGQDRTGQDRTGQDSSYSALKPVSFALYGSRVNMHANATSTIH